jgi:hypothetical protein
MKNLLSALILLLPSCKNGQNEKPATDLKTVDEVTITSNSDQEGTFDSFEMLRPLAPLFQQPPQIPDCKLGKGITFFDHTQNSNPGARYDYAELDFGIVRLADQADIALGFVEYATSPSENIARSPTSFSYLTSEEKQLKSGEIVQVFINESETEIRNSEGIFRSSKVMKTSVLVVEKSGDQLTKVIFAGGKSKRGLFDRKSVECGTLPDGVSF